MNLDFLTPELFDALVWIVFAVGLVLAGIRLYQDLTRPFQPPKGTRLKSRRPKIPGPPSPLGDDSRSTAYGSPAADGDPDPED